MTDLKSLEPWIETYTGKHMYFLNPTVEMIDIEDIAHSLSKQCRFAGHTHRFYSVAEHSVNVSNLSVKNKLAGLLHDASEAYLIDVPSPLKQYLTGYKDIENRVMKVIAEKFGFNWPMEEDVHDADMVQLKTEAKYLLPSEGKDWAHLYKTKLVDGIKPKCMSPAIAKEMFLGLFEYLNNESDIKRTKRTSCAAA